MPPRRRCRWRRHRSPRPAGSPRLGCRPALRSGTASPATPPGSDVERLAATAAALFVRIAKGKAALQAFLDVIHLGAEDEHDRLWINEDGHTLVFDDFVE